MLKSRCFAALVCASVSVAGPALGQPPRPPSGVAFAAGFQPGSQQLFALDLSGTPVGDFPTSLKLLNGNVEVVLKNGVRMLKASAASEFVISLPQVLPQDFTLEFDLIPKSCCPPPDLSIEGTPRINQGEGSAHLLWQLDGYLAVIGGAQDNYETPMPENLRTSLPGVRTQVGVSVSGRTIKLYTNGRRLYTLDRQFARGQVLRVHLGGVSDANPVYLAGLRIATGAPQPTIVQSTPQPGPGTAGPNTPPAPRGTPQPVIPRPPVPPPPGSGASTPAPTPSPPPVATIPGAASGPIGTLGSATRGAARCTPSAAPGAPPLNYQVGGGRVGGAVLEWWKEANAEYLVERSPDPGDGSRSWTRLTSTCDTPDGMFHFMRLWEDGNSYPAVNMTDVYPGLQLGAPYVYRVTVIRPDGTSGSSEGPYTTSGAVFLSSPIAAVNGNTVKIAADISYCTTPSMRCDPWMMEFLVTSSSVGFQYSSRQPWVDSYDPSLPLTVPGGVEGAFAFTIPGVPSGTHTFTLTAIYQPDFQIAAGSVTVVVP